MAIAVALLIISLTVGQFSSIAGVSNLLSVTILAARFCNFSRVCSLVAPLHPPQNNSSENGALQYLDTVYLMCFEVKIFCHIISVWPPVYRERTKMVHYRKFQNYTTVRGGCIVKWVSCSFTFASFAFGIFIHSSCFSFVVLVFLRVDYFACRGFFSRITQVLHSVLTWCTRKASCIFSTRCCTALDSPPLSH